ncbi:hypothetical protein HDU98_008928 [Podochytrium sp. JEL0797]|nr:hypothetical protein HDU98_008928 [Podochytrium sp. JEL0797]
MGGYTMGLSAKAPGLLKNRLANDLVLPMGQFGDPKYVDMSNEHRAEMKTVLYGAGRSNRAAHNGSVEGATRPADISRPDNHTTHFSLGDDTNTYKSITKSTFRGFGDHQPYVEIKRDIKKKSTVLDMPDGEPGETISVQKADYTDAGLNSRALQVDNTMTVKDLKSTHFTLGNDEAIYQTSQYQSTFQGPPSSYTNDNLTHKVNHYRTSICMKDDDLSHEKHSTHHRDFKKSSGQHAFFNDAREIAQQHKHNSQNSCIAFGNTNAQTRSITKTDFPVPNAASYPPHVKNGAQNEYSPISGSRSSGPFSGGSVMKSSYVYFCKEGAEMPEDGSAPHATDAVRNEFLDSMGASRTLGKNLRGHHFTLGNDDASMNGGSVMKNAYLNHGNEEYKKHRVARPGKEWRFDSTLENTVTRYPKDGSTYQTVSDVTYVHHGNFVPPKAFKPSTMSFLTVSAEDSDYRLKNEPRMGGMLLSTETKRKFVPPEVMMYQQPDPILQRS